MAYKPVALVCALIVGALSCSGDRDAPTGPSLAPRNESRLAGTGGWTAKAPMPTARYFHGVGVLRDASGQQILYALGGFDPTDDAGGRPAHTRSIDAYNLATDTWTTKPAPVMPAWLNGVGVIGGKLYVPGGGFESGEGLDPTERLMVYDPGRDTWLRRADLPKPIAAGVSGVIDGKLFVLAGVEGFRPYQPAWKQSRRLYRYNPTTDTWASRAWCPSVHQHGAGGVISGKLYVAGGYDSQKLDIYDPATNSWSPGAALPVPVGTVAGAVLAGRLYVIGTAVLVYTPTTNRWTVLPSLLTPRWALAAARVMLGGEPHIVTTGGMREEVGHLTEAYRR